MLVVCRQKWEGSRRTFCAYTHLILGVVLEEALDSAAWEL